ncbi:MAG: hypothetical protein HY918_00085 [Candidatus Doudnabacteria bacterium]|nr:hypothetical protein [Candidatus Doudnabacteria bacterium]
MNKKLLSAVGLFVLGLTLVAQQTVATIAYIDANAVEFGVGSHVQGKVLGASTSGLVGYWKLDEASASSAADSSGSNYNGTLVNNPTWSAGKINGGLSLNPGTTKNQYVSLPSISLGNSEVTISAWANIRSYSTNVPFISKGTNIYRNGSEWGLWIYGGGNLEARRGGQYITALTKVTLNSWHNYATVMSASSTTVYVDGVKVFTGAGLPTTAIGGTTGIGGWGGTGNLDGTLDEIRVYNRALSATEILDIYNDTGSGQPPVDTTAPVISGVTSSSITTASAAITWNTDEIADGLVEYGETTSYGSSSGLVSNLTSSHNISLTGLNPSTQYHYRVKSADASGNQAVSGDNTFTTSAAQIIDTQAPTVPSGLAVSGVSSSSVNFSWNASTDNVGVFGYRVYRNGSIVGTTTAASFTDSQLQPSTAYVYEVSAYDAAGNFSDRSAQLQVTTSEASGDSVAPSVPKHLYAFRTTASSTTLTWDSSTDNVGVSGYNVYRFGLKIGTTVTTKFVDTGLLFGRGYSYSVSAIDAAGNESSQSSITNVVMPINNYASFRGDSLCAPPATITANAQKNLNAVKLNLPSMLADADNYDALIAPFRSSADVNVKDSVNMVDLGVRLLRTIPMAINCTPQDFDYTLSLSRLQSIQQSLPYFYNKAQNSQDPYAGMKRGTVAVRSDIDGHIDYYYFALPTNYNPAVKYRLQVILHFAGTCAWEAAGLSSFKPLTGDLIVGTPSSASALASTITDTIYIVPCGRGASSSYAVLAQKTILDEIADAMRRYPIDSNYVSISGSSMGTTGGVNLSAHYPDLFAGILMFTGSPDFNLPTGDYRYDGSMLYPSVGSVSYGILDTPGDTSSYQKEENFAANLQNLGTAHPGYYKYVKYTDPAGSHGIINQTMIDQAESFLKTAVRNPYPARVAYNMGSEQYDGAYWVHNMTRSNVLSPGSIEAESSSNGSLVTVATTNLKTFSLDLSAGNPLFAGLSTVVVSINGTAITVPTGSTAYFTTATGSWTYSSSPDFGLYKKKGVSGPIADVFMDKPVLMVYGSKQGNSAAMGSVLAEQLTQAYFGSSISQDSYIHYGKFEIKADVDVTPDDIQNKNLVLFGTPNQNSLVASMSASLPFQISDSGVQIGGKAYTGAKIGWSIVYPNPLNPSRYVLFASENYNMGIVGFLNTNVLQNDYVILQGLDSGFYTRKVLTQGLFNSQWQK